MDAQISGIDLHVVSDHVIICYACARKYKTKGEYDRHLRKMHDVQNDNCGIYEIVDSDIANILHAAGSELGTDECYPVVIRNTESLAYFSNKDNIWKVGGNVKRRTFLPAFLQSTTVFAKLFYWTGQ